MVLCRCVAQSNPPGATRFLVKSIRSIAISHDAARCSIAVSQNPCPRKIVLHKVLVDQNDGGDADNEADYAGGDHFTDDSTLDSPFMDKEVSNTESDERDNRDDKYLETEGCCRHDTGFKSCASSGRRDLFGGDIPSRLPPPFEPRACTDLGSAVNPDLDLTEDLPTPRKVNFSSNTRFGPSPRSSNAARTVAVHSSKLSTVNSTTRVRLSWCTLQPDTCAIKNRT